MTAAITPPQQQTIADTITDWSQPLAFAQFDPALGTLSGIAFGLAGDVTGNIILDNLDGAPAAFGVTFNGELQLAAPDGTPLLGIAPVASGGAMLAAGAMTTLSGITASSRTEADFQPGNGPGGFALAPFIGTGSVALPVTAQARLHVTGPGNLELVSQATAGASVTMQYDYAPANGGGSGSSSGGTTIVDSFGPGFVAMTTAAVTTVAQTFRFADRTTGWNDSAAVAQFDPALGTLETVNITLSGNIAAVIAAENLGADATPFSASDIATLTLDLPGGTPTMATAATVSDSMSLAGFDGSADYAGASGHADVLAARSPGPIQYQLLGDPADLAAFTGRGVVVLPISGTSAASIDGPGNLMAALLTEAGATASVSYTYLPAASGPDTGNLGGELRSPSGTAATVSDIGLPATVDTSASGGGSGGADYTVFDATKHQPGAATPQPYAGAAGGPTQALLDHSGDNLAVAVTSDNWLIATGGGNDAITVHGGNNVIFAGGGSNWLVGGGGDDTFGVYAGGGDAWDAVGNFHAGDWLVVWGLTAQTAALSWQNGLGAPGYAGLTLDATAPDGSATLVTLARYYGTADLDNGRLSTGFGDGYFYVHANS